MKEINKKVIQDSLFEKMEEHSDSLHSKSEIKSSLVIGAGYLALSFGCVYLIKSNIYLGPIWSLVLVLLVPFLVPIGLLAT